MKKILLLTAALLMGNSVLAEIEPDPTTTAKYWVDLYRKKNELQHSYFELGYKADLEIQKIDKLLETDELVEKLEKLEDRKDECEGSFTCSDEEMVRLYKEMRTLNKRQELMSAAEDFVDAENDQKEWLARSPQMPLSENQRKNLTDVLNRRVELKADQLFVLEGKKTATNEEIEKWEEEFNRLSDALFQFDEATTMMGVVVRDRIEENDPAPHAKAVCESYIEKYKDDPEKKQFVERVRLELDYLNRNYPDISASERIENPEDKFQFGLDGQGRIVSVGIL